MSIDSDTMTVLLGGLGALFAAAFGAFETRLRPLLADMADGLRAHRAEDARGHEATQTAVARLAAKLGA